MTKSENRAAAKAYHAEQEAKRQELARRDAVKADLEQLAALRHYLIFNLRSRVDAHDLISAIDDYAGKLTGDRTALHTKRHSIG